MSSSLVTVTSEAEKIVVWIARVSNPTNQGEEKNNERLINYLISHKHWSPFEHAFLTVQIDAPKYVTAQLLRHRSFTFQEFSMRYAKYHVLNKKDIPIPDLRLAGTTNRQSSKEMVSEKDMENKKYFQGRIAEIFSDIKTLYDEMIFHNIALETARGILPVCHTSRILMSGSIRSWIHYLELRCQDDTQKEHREIANDIKNIFIQQFPIISKALKWIE